MNIPVVRGVRILTEEQITALSDSSLKLYRSKVLKERRNAHRVGTAEEIRAFDYVANAVNRENLARGGSFRFPQSPERV